MNKVGLGIAIAGIVLLIAASLVFFVGVPEIIEKKVKEETRLEEGSDTLEKWTNVPVPIYLKFSFFNISNPEALEVGDNFTFQEVGPYVWEEKRYKKIYSTNEDEDTITYEEFKIYTFREDLSFGSQEDTVNILNFPYIAVSTIITKTLNGIGTSIPIGLLQAAGETFTRLNVKVRDVIFDGIELKPIYNTIVGLNPGGTPPEFAEGRFAFYRGKNDTSDGLYTIKRGIKNHEDFGKIVEFDHEPELSWWTNTSLPHYEQQYCNKINGTDGSIFAPFFEKDRILRIFVSDICRSIYLTFNKEIEFHDIKGYRFTIPFRMFEHPDTNPDNRCFCTNPGGTLAHFCAGGLIRIYACKHGAPVISSQPHFLDGDAILFDYLNGIEPVRDLHETQIDVEPRSGQLLRAAKRIQISAELQRLQGASAFNVIPKQGLLVPMFWVEEHAELDEKNINDLKDKLIKPLKVINIVQWVVIGVTAAIVLVGVAIAIIKR